MALISLKNVVKSYPVGREELLVLDNISLDIDEGDLLAVTGPSGAGKSTLMHIMGGLEKPNSGDVLFNGAEIYNLHGTDLDKYRNQNVGFVFQSHYLLDDFTALENVAVPALFAGANMREASERAETLLASVGLSDRTGHFPKELSGGEQQRVALARALMNNPTMILADEPTGNLDKANSRTVQDILFALRDIGIAVVIVTHDQQIADQCGRVFHLQKV